jgi:hypothetical protein
VPWFAGWGKAGLCGLLWLVGWAELWDLVCLVLWAGLCALVCEVEVEIDCVAFLLGGSRAGLCDMDAGLG